MNTLNAVESIFFTALEKDTPEARAAYLDEACQADANLRGCVERLLKAHPKADGFMQAPAPGPSATMDRPPIEERPGSIIGPYKLLQQLGEGGFGVVFLAEQEQPVRRKVALKIIKPGMDSKQVIARFEAERQALALMDHPNIARVIDGGMTSGEPGGVSPGRPYFVMELVKGVPITEFCDQNRLTPRERLELFIPVCQAVQHAHQKGIIHRDLKPSNVLVTLYDDKPVPKVIDFGVAKAIHHNLTEQTLFTKVGQVIGTLEYMSPEQASLNALDVDTRSDVYSLGVLLYELLTGSTPLGKEQFQGAAFMEMLRLIREVEPPKPSARLSQSGDGLAHIAAYRKSDSQRLPKQVKGDLDWIAMKALEKDRGRRYETASALAADAQRFLDDEPIEARPPSAWYRFRKMARRNRAAVTAAGLVAATLLVSTVVAWLFALDARDSAQRANDEMQIADAQRLIAVEQKSLAAKNEQLAKDKEKMANDNEILAELARKKAEANETKAEWRLYASQIASAQAAWESDDLPLFYHYLKQCRSDFRGWEHDYLYTLASQNQETLGVPARDTTGQVGVDSVAFHPNGKLLASTMEGRAKDKRSVKVWDLTTGREVRTLDGAGCVAFSPDGKHLATRATDTVAVVYDVASGKVVQQLSGHNGPIRCMAFSPNSKLLACATSGRRSTRDPEPGVVKLWDLERGTDQTLTGHKNQVLSVAFSPDGTLLASAGWDQTLKVWDVASGKDVQALKGHTEGVRSVAFHPGGKLLASSSFDKTVKVWDLAAGKEVHSFPEQGTYSWVAFSPDGKHLASASGLGVAPRVGSVRVWDVASGKEVWASKGQPIGFFSVAFSADGKRLATGMGNGTVRLWDNKPATMTIKGTRDAFTFSPDSKRFAAATGSWQAFPTPGMPKEGPPKGEEVNMKVWDAGSGQEIAKLQPPADVGPGWYVVRVAVSPDLTLFAYSRAARPGVHSPGTVKIWDVVSSKQVQTLEGPKHILTMDFSPDGKRLAAIASYDNAKIDRMEKIKVWDVAGGKEVLSLDKPGAKSVRFSPNGQLLAIALVDETTLYDVDNGHLVRTIKGAGTAFSADGKRLAGPSGDKTVKVWDTATGKEVLTLHGHTESVNSVAFSPDGKRLATTSRDKTVKLWDASSGQEVLTLKQSARSVAFSPDGKRLAIGILSTTRILEASKSMPEQGPK